MSDGRAPRRSLFAVWHWSRWKLAVVVVPMAVAAYPLSEAPTLRFRREFENMSRRPASPFVPIWGPTVYDADEVVFRPAHWVFDNTPLQSPLIAWANLWGVEVEVRLYSAARTGRLFGPLEEWEVSESAL